jgi:NADPH2:quinone reductase
MHLRAWKVTGRGEPQEVLQLVDGAAVPEPGEGQIRLRVAAAGVGLPDAYMCRGSYPLTPKLPFTPGQEVAGVVTAAGPGARRAVGERVMAVTAFFLGHGSFAEECLALDDFALGVPDAMDDAEAACFTIPFHTAYIGLVRRAALVAGETLLVLGGAGGTGSAALQLGKSIGARVIAVAGGPEKCAFCQELGADLSIDYRSDHIAAAVRDATGGRGADVIYDPVGGESFQAATECIANEGRLLAVGFASGSWGEPQVGHMVQHNYSVMGVIPSGYDYAFKVAAHDKLLEQWKRGALRAPVYRRFGFEHVPDAIALLAQGSVMGKVVISLGGNAERDQGS